MSQNKLNSNLQYLAAFSLVASGVTWYLASNYPLLWQIFLALSGAAFVGATWLGRGDIKHSLSRKATRYGLNSLFMSLVVFAIVVVINLIALNHDQKIDLTKNKLHTLSDQTIKILKSLNKDVTLRAFISPMQMQEYNDVFDKYAYYSKHVKKEFIDVDREPLLVRQYDVKQTGVILVESDSRTARVEGLSGASDPKMEEKLTNGIIQVEKGEKKKIYFVNGHGEHLINDATKEGYTGMRDTLASGRFNVEELNLVEKDSVPADAEILIVAGPKKDFMTHEIAELTAYLHRGGKLLLMLEPDSSTTLQPLLTKYGVAWKEKKAVLERNRLQQLADNNPLTPIVTSYDNNHEITRDARQMSIFAVATPVEKAEKIPEGVTVSSLFSTSKFSSEVSVEGNRLAVNEKNDRKGPLSLALAVSGKVEKAGDKKEEKKADAITPEGEEKGLEYRMVVVGDSDFPTNALRGYGLNSDLFQNMVSWLAKEEDLISIRPKPTDESSFDITEQRMRIINLASIVVLPFGMFLSGIAVWFSRRRK